MQASPRPETMASPSPVLTSPVLTFQAVAWSPEHAATDVDVRIVRVNGELDVHVGDLHLCDPSIAFRKSGVVVDDRRRGQVEQDIAIFVDDIHYVFVHSANIPECREVFGSTDLIMDFVSTVGHHLVTFGMLQGPQWTYVCPLTRFVDAYYPLEAVTHSFLQRTGAGSRGFDWIVMLDGTGGYVPLYDMYHPSLNKSQLMRALCEILPETQDYGPGAHDWAVVCGYILSQADVPEQELKQPDSDASDSDFDPEYS